MHKTDFSQEKKSDSKIRLLLFFIFTKAEIAMKYHLKFLRKHFS